MIVQPGADRALADRAVALWEWRAEDARLEVAVEVRKGVLYARAFTLVGVDGRARAGRSC